jgi:4-amino-4-deoxy-L-arabinose transferase-like glycosyltransferase
MVAAFISLAAALLVHYSAGPYVVFVTLHYVLWLFWRRRDKWKELAAIGVTCAVLLASWFGWALAVYGDAALSSISTKTPNQQAQESGVMTVAANLWDSFFPPIIRDPSLANRFDQQNSIGKFRDVVFITYQPNIVFGMGVVGGPVVVWLVWSHLRRKTKRGRFERAFWLAFMPVTIVLGAVVVGGREPFGLAYGTLLSLQAIGLILLATAITQRRILTGLVLVGALADFSLGILLHAHVESLENGNGKSFYSDLVYTNGALRHADPGPDTLSDVAWQNWFDKHRSALCDEWLTELPARHKADANFQLIWSVRQREILDLKKEDDAQWGGWYARHNGEMTFWGDHIAGRFGERVPIALLIALLTGLIAVYIMQTPAASPSMIDDKATQPPPVKRGRKKSSR